MGNYLNVKPLEKGRDQSALKQFKRIKTDDLFVVFTDYYNTIYPRKQLKQEEFDEIFSPILNNIGNVFNRLKKDGDVVDMYEAFVGMTVFSKGDFDKKLLGLFRSFDVDNGGTIDRQELLMFMYSAIYGLCKLLQLESPSRTAVLDYSYVVFLDIDGDNSGEIDF